jgi:hypothetical protein
MRQWCRRRTMVKRVWQSMQSRTCATVAPSCVTSHALSASTVSARVPKRLDYPMLAAAPLSSAAEPGSSQALSDTSTMGRVLPSRDGPVPPHGRTVP